MSEFLIAINESYVRDVQYCPDPDLYDTDKWLDLENCEVVLGVFNGEDEEKVINYASKEFNVNKDILIAYELVKF